MKDGTSGSTKGVKLFLRQNGWCHCGRSCNSFTGRLEEGVSVYDCEHVSGTNWRGVGPAFEKRERDFRGQQRKNLGSVEAKWYLVSGDRVGTGGDGDPLLRNVVAHKMVEWDGKDYFVEVSEAKGQIWSDHEGYPKCHCQTIYDVHG